MLLTFERMGALRWILVLWGVLVAAFLLLPVLFIVALSFGSSRWLQFPPPAWTLRWYQELLADPRWLDSILTSFKVAALVTVASVLLGLLAAFGLVRGRFPGREVLRAFFLTPMILPVVVLAVALYALFLRVGLNGTLAGFVIGHLILALPFSIISITGALEGFDKAIEDAAVVCGAHPFEAKLRVTLPALKLGLFGAAVFSFLVSWDEVIVAIFMASPTLQTFPVRIWGVLRQDLSPVIAAASSLLVLLTLVLMAAAALVRRGSRR
ncbi:MAG: ABC transporter permease [Geminicoccaceae bacterium]|nr:ABC transporter permease [Geminicoccaceae bacterium]